MNRATLISILVVATSAFGVACQKSGAEEQQKANEAQEQANKEIGRANAQANEAQRNANQKIDDIQTDFLKMRDDYRSKTMSDVDSIDQKIAKLDAKAAGPGKTNADLQARLPAIHAQRDVLGRDLRSLDMTSSATFDGTKARLDKEVSDLKAAVDKAL